MKKPSLSSLAAGRAGGSSSTTKTTTPCCAKIGLKRGPWTPEEDELLANYIKKEGEGRWRILPKKAGLLRCGKSCRLRWMNYLRPCVKRGHITSDEEDLILRLHRLLGNRWSLIAGRIPGRTDNEIKNYWNTHLSKKLISQGIDPRTHKPMNPNYSSIVDHNKPSSSQENHNSVSILADYVPFETGLDPLYQMNFETVAPDRDDHTNMCTIDRGFRMFDASLGNENDEVFSSFLNSLMNEDHVYNTQPNQQPNLIVGQNSDPIVSSTTAAFTVTDTANAQN